MKLISFNLLFLLVLVNCKPKTPDSTLDYACSGTLNEFFGNNSHDFFSKFSIDLESNETNDTFMYVLFYESHTPLLKPNLISSYRLNKGNVKRRIVRYYHDYSYLAYTMEDFNKLEKYIQKNEISETLGFYYLEKALNGNYKTNVLNYINATNDCFIDSSIVHKSISSNYYSNPQIIFIVKKSNKVFLTLHSSLLPINEFNIIEENMEDAQKLGFGFNVKKEKNQIMITYPKSPLLCK
jgi:hypothetical protein